MPDKTEKSLDPADTPDFSVACLDFESGVTGRVTCSIAAPYDHRMRIIGERGEASADTSRHYEAPVWLEPFVPFTLKARNLAAVRRGGLLGRGFGVGGRRVPLIQTPPPGAEARHDEIDGRGPGAWLRRIRRAQFGQQDKMIGLAELQDAITRERPHFPSPDFTLHITELTLAIQAAGPDGASQSLQTRFTPLSPPDASRAVAPDYLAYARPGPLPRALSALLGRAGGRRH